MHIQHDRFNRLYNPYLDEAIFHGMVEVCAYFKYEQRGFVGGHALQDWLEAEKEVSKRCYYWVQQD